MSTSIVEPVRVMVDLETMGTGPTAAIIAIGAVVFDDYAVSSSYYQTVSLGSSVSVGLTMDPSTVMWWMAQSDAARGEFATSGQVEITEALATFSVWLAKNVGDREVEIWGNGASFDNVILRNAYETVGRAVPWMFWADRCYRTMKAMRPDIRMERTGTHHNALHDAESQAEHLIRIFAAL